MTSIVKLQALSGVDGETPPCYILQVDAFRFLLDCGWDEDFSMGHIETLKKHAPQIDAVLLSYPDPFHLGALPYMVGRGGLNCPIYATVPVYKMGQMFLYDLYQSRHNTEDFDIFTLDDIDAAFDKILQLKYSQTVNLKGKGHGLQITPLPAGHMIGGCLWKIVKDGEEEIVYAIDYNHKKERHLNGCLFEEIGRPHLLITDAFNAEHAHARRRLRDEQLMNNIVQTMRNDGNVLVAVDTAGRVLELAHLLDQMWRTQEAGLMAYSLALLNNVSYNVVEFAKSQVEWMSEKIMRAFEDRRNNPFQFRHLQLCHSLAELSRVPEPKVVLTSTPDLQTGFSRELFIQWCGNPKNTIILTNRTSPGTLARELIDNPGQRNVTLEVRKRVRLEGAELEEHQRQERERRQVESARRKAEQAKKDRGEESSDDSDDEAGDETTPGAVATKTKHDIMIKNENKGRTGFFKQAKKSYPMFPFMEDRIKWDDYGEVIRPEDYMIAESTQVEEEKMDTSKQEEEKEIENYEVPTKCIVLNQLLDINATVLYIDFEGRSDKDSIRRILAQIKPRQLVLVHGNPKATASLAEYCRNTRDLVQGQVFTPRLNEVIDATKESHIFQVRLKDSVVSALKFSKARDIEVAWVDGQLDLSLAKADTSAIYETEDGVRKMIKDTDEKMEDDTETELVPTLVSIPPTQVTGHSAVFLNEPKLSDFKQLLISQGISAEFSGGVLICNGVVAVRRGEAGKLQLEGSLCDDYFRIRELLYDQFAII